MTPEQLSKIISPTVLNRWKRTLNMEDWEYSVTLKELDGSWGECINQPKYHMSHIYVDPAKHSTKEEALDTLLHEILHSLHGDFEIAMESVIKQLNPAAQPLAEDLMSMACEKFVTRMQVMLKKMGYELNGKRID